MTPLHLTVLLLTMAMTAWGAAIAVSASTIAGATPSPERTAAAAPELLRRDIPVDNATSVALDIINTALLNLAYIEPVPYGEVKHPCPRSTIFRPLQHM
ncbi:hypothetical protein B0T18DRAFT_405861 [Schizothecium vesticola]|uniref:Antifreeze protein n=1 Tax=Schizothecium vesticola TaxID=314040 RepID=A0AA40F1D7_9PEZI|nr:hypothetical protein B0T18DRAFT_405861 [Schizothecium vesticola]